MYVLIYFKLHKHTNKYEKSVHCLRLAFDLVLYSLVIAGLDETVAWDSPLSGRPLLHASTNLIHEMHVYNYICLIFA